MDRFLSSHIFLRILALVLAFILWFGVNSPDSGAGTTEPTTYEHFPFPIQVQTGPGTVVTAMNYDTATVAVNENTANLSTLPAQMAGVQVVADASKLSPGVHVLPLTATNLPAVGATVIQPQTVTVTIATKASTTTPVKLQVLGTPASLFVQGTASTNVPFATISGPQAAVSKVTNVIALVNIQGATASVTRSVSLNAIDGSGRLVSGVSITPANVSVTVPISASNSTAGVTPQIVGQPAPGYDVAGVTVNPSTLHALSTAGGDVLPSVTVPVDVSGLTQTKTIRVSVPKVPGASQLSPSTVAVTVQIEKSLSKVFTGVPLEVKNQNPGRSVVLTGDTTVDVTVSGPQSVIEGLTQNDILVYIDAGQLSDSDTTAPLVIQLPHWVKLTHLSTERVAVSVLG